MSQTMLTPMNPEDFIQAFSTDTYEDVLQHASAPYDPVKAREYYLRTRKLKGRKKGSFEPTSGNRNATYTVKTGSGGKGQVRLTAQQLTEQRAYADARVESISKKLKDLNDRLRKKMAAARKANKPPTAAEKAKAAREARKYRDKHKQEIKTKARQAAKKAPAKKSSSRDTVASLKKSIATTKASLKEAVAKQRSLAAAKKNG